MADSAFSWLATAAQSPLNASPFGFHAGIIKQGILYKNKGLSKGGEEMQRINF